MAIYHCSIKIISRGKGKSAVAAAAYRAGEKMTNDYDGITHDYTRKGGVVHTEILLTENAPPEFSDRAILWNAVEQIEKAKNSQLAREIELALPVELTQEQNIELTRRYVNEHFVSAGMCADICIHDKNGGNPHAHIMLTMRPFEPDGIWGAKAHKINGKKVCTTDWNEQTKAERWRSGWADAVNAALERQGVEERVDHRSYARQGIEQIPTVHLGVAVSAMEKRGIATELGDLNREIHAKNNLLKQIIAKIRELKDWLKDALSPPAPPTLAALLQDILDKGEQVDRYGRTRNLKPVKQALDFLKENGISTLPELRESYKDLYTKFENARVNLNHTDSRIDTLDERIRQGEIFLQHRELYAEYQKLKPRKQPKFYEAHRTKLALFEAAMRYFKANNIGSNFSIPAWKERRTELFTKRSNQYRQYEALKNQHDTASTVLFTAEDVSRRAARDRNPLKRKPPQRGGMAR